MAEDYDNGSDAEASDDSAVHNDSGGVEGEDSTQAIDSPEGQDGQDGQEQGDDSSISVGAEDGLEGSPGGSSGVIQPPMDDGSRKKLWFILSIAGAALLILVVILVIVFSKDNPVTLPGQEAGVNNSGVLERGGSSGTLSPAASQIVSCLSAESPTETCRLAFKDSHIGVICQSLLGSSIDKCYERAASYGNNPAYCDKVADVTLRSLCYGEVSGSH